MPFALAPGDPPPAPGCRPDRPGVFSMHCGWNCKPGSRTPSAKVWRGCPRYRRSSAQVPDLRVLSPWLPSVWSPLHYLRFFALLVSPSGWLHVAGRGGSNPRKIARLNAKNAARPKAATERVRYQMRPLRQDAHAGRTRNKAWVLPNQRGCTRSQEHFNTVSRSGLGRRVPAICPATDESIQSTTLQFSAS